MINPFLGFSDGTEVICSDPIDIDGRMCVRVLFKRWNAKRNDFDRMECLLPDGEMTGVKGFSQEEISYHHGKMLQMQDNILEWSKEDAEERRDEEALDKFLTRGGMSSGK